MSIYVFFEYLFIFIGPFIIGYFISVFLEPIVKLLVNKCRLNRGISAIVSILLMISIIGGSIFLIVSQLISQLRIFLSNDLSLYFDLIIQTIDKITDFLPSLFFYFPEQTKDSINDIMKNILNGSLTFLATQLKYFSLALIKSIPSFFVYLFIGIISSFFFIKDKLAINNLYQKIVPQIVKGHIITFKEGMSFAFLGYIKAQSIIMCFTFTISLIGLLILGNNYALLLAVCIACIDVLPLFGSGFFLWPLSAISFLSSDIKTGVGALIIYGTIQITRQIIEPKILGSQIGLHPLVTLMSVYIGVIVFGFLGIILGPMTVIMTKSIWSNNIKI